MRCLTGKLPVYELRPAVVAPHQISDHVLSFFNMVEARRRVTNRTIHYELGERRLEIQRLGAAIWYEDGTHLWDIGAEGLDDAALEMPAPPLEGLFGNRLARLRNDDCAEVSVTHALLEPSGTRLSVFDIATGERKNKIIDVFQGARFSITVTDPITKADIAAPILGQAARLAMTFRDSASFTSFNYSDWPISRHAGLWPVMPPALDLGPEPPLLESLAIRLAYREDYIAGKWLLYPVWVCEFRARRDELSPTSVDIVPATEVAPTVHRRQSCNRTPETPQSGDLTHTRRAGIVWISKGNSQAPAAVDGLERGLGSLGWQVGFSWGDADAWASDWTDQDDQWIDSVSLVYYHGHAAADRWDLRPPNMRAFSASHTANDQGDLWGRNLRWLIIEACGPLQDSFGTENNTASAFNRWNGAFDGLRMFLGGCGQMGPNAKIAPRCIELAGSAPLMNSWFRANREHRVSVSTKGKVVMVAALMPYDTTTRSIALDQLPSSSDPRMANAATRPTKLVGLWVPVG